MNFGFLESTGFFLVWLAIMALFVGVWWVIFAKVGWPGYAAVAMLVPLVNLLVFIAFAFAEWPIQRELRELRARVGAGDPTG
jgi:hypothetical protein